jgi:hypothetical protein
MADSLTTSSALPDVIEDAEPALVKDRRTSQERGSRLDVPADTALEWPKTVSALPAATPRGDARSAWSNLLVSRMFSGLVLLRITAAYAVMLVLVAGTLSMLGPRVQHSVIRQMSTNLHNLAHGRLDTLLGSAFVTSGGQIYLWLPGLVCLLALAELLWRSGPLVLAFALGHIGATLIVAVVLAAGVQFGWLPSSIARATDVGISYGAVAVLGALTAALPLRWRPVWIGWWLGTALLVAASGEHFHFTATGHTVALMLGMLLSTRFRSAPHWTPQRVVLLAGGVAFGYLTLAKWSLPAPPMAGLAGVGIAVIALRLARRWRTRAVTTAPCATSARTIDPGRAPCQD